MLHYFKTFKIPFGKAVFVYRHIIRIVALVIFKHFSAYRKPVSKTVLCIVLLLSTCVIHASFVSYSAYYKPADLLTNLLSGEWDAKHHVVKWRATPGDVHEFNGVLSAQSMLYSFIDTTFAVDLDGEKQYYVVFHTAPMMTNEDGEFVNANSCHVCGVNLGYFTYSKDKDSIYVDKFKRNFAKHGSFGSRSYSLSIINMGDGYELLKVDDPYEGMGTASVATRFYQEGELLLSIISKENNSGSRNKNEKGYYEFKTAFAYDPKMHTITIRQTGYRLHEQTGRKIVTDKKKKLIVDNYTLQF